MEICSQHLFTVSIFIVSKSFTHFTCQFIDFCQVQHVHYLESSAIKIVTIFSWEVGKYRFKTPLYFLKLKNIIFDVKIDIQYHMQSDSPHTSLPKIAAISYFHASSYNIFHPYDYVYGILLPPKFLSLLKCYNYILV